MQKKHHPIHIHNITHLLYRLIKLCDDVDGERVRKQQRHGENNEWLLGGGRGRADEIFQDECHRIMTARWWHHHNANGDKEALQGRGNANNVLHLQSKQHPDRGIDAKVL